MIDNVVQEMKLMNDSLISRNKELEDNISKLKQKQQTQTENWKKKIQVLHTIYIYFCFIVYDFFF